MEGDVGRRTCGARRVRLQGRSLSLGAFFSGLAFVVGLFLLSGAGLIERLYWLGCGRPTARGVGAFTGPVMVVVGALSTTWHALSEITDEMTLATLRAYLEETSNGRILAAMLVGVLALAALTAVRVPWTDGWVYGLCGVGTLFGIAPNTHAGAMYDPKQWIDVRNGVWPLGAELAHLVAVTVGAVPCSTLRGCARAGTSVKRSLRECAAFPKWRCRRWPCSF